MSLRNPVKYPVKYYSWQDAQAPQLSNADGVIKTILKACLVTGYGSKQGAGWTALFEDAYRIVLRRPLRTGNPPDIKIENGTITGATIRHRIVAQDNPASLDDATELSAINLLARDNMMGNQWHCIATDFAFLLCYQVGLNGNSADKNNFLFIGGLKKLLDSNNEYFVVNAYDGPGVNGISTKSLYSFLNNSSYPIYTWIYDFRRDQQYTSKHYLSNNVPEKYYNNDYFAQRIVINGLAELPFYCAYPSQYEDKTTRQISINSRPMLRYVNIANNTSDARAFYIPLDYWEL